MAVALSVSDLVIPIETTRVFEKDEACTIESRQVLLAGVDLVVDGQVRSKINSHRWISAHALWEHLSSREADHVHEKKKPSTWFQKLPALLEELR